MKSKGFTLIELLVVVAIIGILATITINSLTQARKRARDVDNIQAASQLRTALELYYIDNNQYPDSRSGDEWMGICDQTSSDFQNDLAPYAKGLFDREANANGFCEVFYFSKQLNEYYQNACQTPLFPNEQGYMVAFSASSETRQDQYFFLGRYYLFKKLALQITQ